MTHVHDAHHVDSADGTLFGFTSGIMLAIAALVLAVVIAAAVLLATRAWDNGSSTNNNIPNVPAQSGDTNTGNSGTTGQ